MWSNVSRHRSYWKTVKEVSVIHGQGLEDRTLPVKFLLLSVSETAATEMERSVIGKSYLVIWEKIFPVLIAMVFSSILFYTSQDRRSQRSRR